MNDKAYLSKLFVTSIISVVFLCFGFVITSRLRPTHSNFLKISDVKLE